MTNIINEQSDAMGIGETFYDSEQESDVLQITLDVKRPHFTFYGIVIPVLAALGIVQNIICFCAFQHRHLRSICTMILNALFMSDILFLICLVLIRSPTAWLVEMYNSVEDRGFWDTMAVVQRIYTGVQPVCQMGQCLVCLYTVAVVMEQYCVFFKPVQLYNWSTRDQTIKLIVTVLNITVLVHLMQFFKFVRTPTLYDANPHDRICLSEIYRSDDYQKFDQYVYPILFVALPWVIIFFGVCMILYGKLRSRREHLSGDWPFPDQRLLRVFKSGRSTKTVLLVGALYLLCGGAVCVCQGLTFSKTVYKSLSANCMDIPLDAMFVGFHPAIELTYYAFLTINSSCRLLLCTITNRDFRHVLAAFGARQKARISQFFRKLKIMCDCRRSKGKRSVVTKRPSFPVAENMRSVYKEGPRPSGRDEQPHGTYI